MELDPDTIVLDWADGAEDDPAEVDPARVVVLVTVLVATVVVWERVSTDTLAVCVVIVYAACRRI